MHRNTRSIYSQVIIAIFILNVLFLIKPSYIDDSRAIADIETNLNHSLSDINLNRVDPRLENCPNGDFEVWGNPYSPSSISVSGSEDMHTWYEDSSPTPSEGLRCVGLEVRARNEYEPNEIRFSQSSQNPLTNPSNLTLSFDWWIDEIPFPDTLDYFRLRIAFSQGYYIYYYLGSNGSYTNSTNTVYYEIADNYQQWNQFDRNLTVDCLVGFGVLPTQYYSLNFYLGSATSSYSRVYLDDFNLLNNTAQVGGSLINWDFEATGGWVFTNSDPTYIEQSSSALTGEWCVNSTPVSRGTRASGSISVRINKRLTELNKDVVSFNWKVTDWINASEDTFGLLNFECKMNESNEFNVYFVMWHGGASPPTYNSSGDLFFYIDAFNTTDVWNSFNASIFDLVTTHITTEEVFVDTIRFAFQTDGPDSQFSFLLDNMSFISSGLNAMGFEDQGEVGSPVHEWGTGTNEYSEFSVTNFVYKGDKAANLTLEASSDYYGENDIGEFPLSNQTELILELSFYLENFNFTSDQYLWLEIYTTDENFAYVLSNGSEFTEFDSTHSILLFETISTGKWVNIQLNLIKDYITLFNSSSDAFLSNIDLRASSGSVEGLSIFFDDFYLYEDPAPGIYDILQSPLLPELDDSVTISANIEDPSLDTVILYYRTNSGAFIPISMSQNNGLFQAEIPSHSWDTLVEFYINATDSYNKITVDPVESMYYSYTIGESIEPIIIILSPENDTTVEGVIQVNITAEDTISGIANVEIFIDNTSLVSGSASQYTIDWDTSTVINGDYVIKVEATDAAGNFNQEELHITVKNQADFPLLELMIIITVIAAGTVIIVVIRRRNTQV